MGTREVPVQRTSVVSSRPFGEVVTRLTATIGRPDINAFHAAIGAATTAADLERVVRGAIGSSDLMEFIRFDAGAILRKERNGQAANILRLLVGNPLITCPELHPAWIENETWSPSVIGHCLIPGVR
jgi:hypothetical protein